MNPTVVAIAVPPTTALLVWVWLLKSTSPIASLLGDRSVRRGLGCLMVLVLVVVGLLELLELLVWWLVWWLGWLPVTVGVLVIAVGLRLLWFGLSRKGWYLVTHTPPRRHPGKRIGVKSPELGIVTRLRTDEYPTVIETVEQVEQGDPVVQRVVETIAVLHADGVPRSFLRFPGVEFDAEVAKRLGFAGPEVDDVLDRLCKARLLTADGDRVVMDPTVALAVRLRADDARSVRELIAGAGDVLYTHALSVRTRANEIYFGHSDPSDSAAIAACARALLDQVVTLAWHTRYTYDKALDAILQCNSSLAEVGQLDDAFTLAKQMDQFCARLLGAAHPVSYEAGQNVKAIRQMRQDDSPRPPNNMRSLNGDLTPRPEPAGCGVSSRSR